MTQPDQQGGQRDQNFWPFGAPPSPDPVPEKEPEVNDWFGFAATEVRRKRHPIRTTIIALVCIALVAGVGYYAANTLTRQIATGIVRDQVAQKLNVPSKNDVHVDFGKGSFLLQAFHRKLNSLHVTIDQFTADKVQGKAVLDATSVPFDSSKKIGTMDISVTLDSAALSPLVATQTGESTATARLVGTNVELDNKVTVLGASIPVSVTLTPGATNGQLTFAPVGFGINGKQFSLASFKASPFARPLARLLATRTVCVASSLPAVLTLRSVAVVDGSLLVTVAGGDTTLSSLSTKGVCPA